MDRATSGGDYTGQQQDAKAENLDPYADAIPADRRTVIVIGVRHWRRGSRAAAVAAHGWP